MCLLFQSYDIFKTNYQNGPVINLYYSIYTILNNIKSLSNSFFELLWIKSHTIYFINVIIIICTRLFLLMEVSNFNVSEDYSKDFLTLHTDIFLYNSVKKKSI